LAAEAVFVQQVLPATLDRVAERVEQPAQWLDRLRTRLRGAPWLAAAAAALVLIVSGALLWSWWPGGEIAPPEVALKGALGVEVIAKRGTRVFQVEDGQRLLAGDRLRFSPRAARPGQVMVVNIDAAGRVHLFYPPRGDQSAAWHPAVGALPDSVVLDDSQGEERLVVLFGPAPFGLEEIRRAVRMALDRGTSVGQLSRLPLDLDQVSLRIVKEVGVP